MKHDEAKQLALSRLKLLESEIGMELQIVEEATKELPGGWAFFYNSKLYLETGEIRYALAGNGPILVRIGDGAVTDGGSEVPFEKYASRFFSD